MTTIAHSDRQFFSQALYSRSPPGARSARPRSSGAPFMTRFCHYYLDGKVEQCPAGKHCSFAHSPEELRYFKNSGEKRNVDCRNWLAEGKCIYGDNCMFLHRPDCRPWQEGKRCGEPGCCPPHERSEKPRGGSTKCEYLHRADCRQWLDSEKCGSPGKCLLLHRANCREWDRVGKCSLGPRCQYLHRTGSGNISTSNSNSSMSENVADLHLREPMQEPVDDSGGDYASICSPSDPVVTAEEVNMRRCSLGVAVARP